MSNSYDVSVALNFRIRFPEVCAVCGKPCQVRFPIKANPNGYRGAWKWMFGLTNRYDIPCHHTCYKSIRGSLLKRNLILLGMATFVLLIGIYFDFPRWIIYLLVVLFVTPFVIWQVKNPEAIEFMREDGKMVFTFRNELYAKEFALLNSSIVEISHR